VAVIGRVGGNAAGFKTIQWRWKPIAGASSYRLYNSDDVFITEVSDTKWVQGGLLPSTQYKLKVRPVINGVESTDYLESRYVTTETLPNVPTSVLVESVKDNTVKLTFIY